MNKFDTLIEDDIDEVFLARHIRDWKEAAKNLKDAEFLEDEARHKMIRALEFMGYTHLDAHGIKAERVTRKGAIEYAAIPQLANIDLEIYRRPEMKFWCFKASLND